MPRIFSTVPCFPVADVGATIRWYEGYLGFKGEPFPVTEPYQFAILFRDHAEIMLQRLRDYEKPDLYKRRDGGVWDTYLRMEGLREFYESVRERVDIIRPLQRMPYPQWEFEVRDPNGYVLVFSEQAD